MEKFIYIQIVNSEDKSIAKTRELCEKLERKKNHGAERERERERDHQIKEMTKSFQYSITSLVL